MRERVRRRALATVLATLMSALAPAQAQVQSCKQVPVTMALKFVGPNLVPTVLSDVETLKADVALDLAHSKRYVTQRGASRLKLRVMRGFFDFEGGKVELPLSLFGTAGKLTLDMEKRADGDVAWDLSIGAESLFRSKGYTNFQDLELSLHDGFARAFTPTGPCMRVNLAYWDPEVVQLPLSRLAEDGIPHFPVSVNGITLDAIFSTTDARSMITPAAAGRAGLAKANAGAGAQAAFKRFEIGSERIEEGYLDIAEHAYPADVVLGNEFLRAHRILISRVQKKLYVGYMSGPPFPAAGTLSYWVEREAQTGNGAAQQIVWQLTQAGQKPIDQRPAATWLRNAVLDNVPLASEEAGRQSRQHGRHAESQAVLRRALATNLQHPFLALELYLSTRQAGDAARAEQELRTVFQETSGMGWPRPLLAFYLGESKAEDVMAAARKEPERAAPRSCAANLFLAEYYETAGPTDQARQYRASHDQQCMAAPIRDTRPGS